MCHRLKVLRVAVLQGQRQRTRGTFFCWFQRADAPAQVAATRILEKFPENSRALPVVDAVLMNRGLKSPGDLKNRRPVSVAVHGAAGDWLIFRPFVRCAGPRHWKAEKCACPLTTDWTRLSFAQRVLPHQLRSPGVLATATLAEVFWEKLHFRAIFLMGFAARNRIKE